MKSNEKENMQSQLLIKMVRIVMVNVFGCTFEFETNSNNHCHLSAFVLKKNAERNLYCH